MGVFARDAEVMAVDAFAAEETKQLVEKAQVVDRNRKFDVSAVSRAAIVGSQTARGASVPD